MYNVDIFRSLVLKSQYVYISDLFAMYSHPLLDPELNPRSLQNKVQMDLCYYFVRRGSENIYNWTKKTFEVKTDEATGIAYIDKIEDEQTKNHQEVDSEIITAFMPEQRGSKMCPVMSFTTYVSALSPKSDKLWQSVKFKDFNYNNKMWYGPGPLGQNMLDSFITKLAREIGMEKKILEQQPPCVWYNRVNKE